VWVPLRLPQGPIGTALSAQLIGLAEQGIPISTGGRIAHPLFQCDFDLEHRRVLVPKLRIGEIVNVSVRWGIGRDGEPEVLGMDLCRSSKS